MLSMDLSKAFDRVNIKTLLLHLNEIGIKNECLKLFESFLMNRKQYVLINDTKNDMKTVIKGVPQGSKLAATLFIIYINNIFKLPLKFYADDGNLIFQSDKYKNLIEDMTYDLHLIDNWIEKNNLKLNIAKTKIMLFDNGKKMTRCIILLD